MSAVNTVNTVDKTIVAYANDNLGTSVTNSRVNDYNDCVSKTLENVLSPRRSVADYLGFPVNDNQ